MIGKSKIALLGAALGATAMLAAPAQAKDFDFSGKQIKLLSASVSAAHTENTPACSRST